MHTEIIIDSDWDSLFEPSLKTLIIFANGE